MKKTFCLIILIFFLIIQTFGQGIVTKANYQLANNWTVQKQFQRTRNIWIVPSWVNDTDLFTYKHVKDNVNNYYLADPQNKNKDKLFNMQKLCALLETNLNKNLNWRNINLLNIKINSTLTSINFSFNNIDYEYNPADNSLINIEKLDHQLNNNGMIKSPDGRYGVFIKAFNLYFLSYEQSVEDTIQITDYGQENYELNPNRLHWSPDSRYIAFIMEDWRNVGDLWLINHYTEPRPTLQTFKWPMVSEQIEQYELWIYDIKKDTLLKIRAEKWKDQTLDQVQWSPDSRIIYFQRLSRDWKILDLCFADPGDGKCGVLIEEREKRQIINRLPYYILESTGEIIWWSWRDGWNHYYLYDKRGYLKVQITKGNYNTGNIVRIDEANRILYFMANAKEPGRNPYYHHLYSIDLNGDGLSLLTPEDAEHEIFFSETGNFFVDRYSRSDLPPVTIVRNSTGEMIMELEDADISPLEKEGWKKPEIFHVKAADDRTDIWGVMFKPFDFDPAKKYPVITYGYPGKETESLPWRFSHNSWVTAISNALAQYGFIVIVAGNRGGSPERSYDYYNYGENNFRNYPVADRKRVVERMAETYSFIDIDRVGIMGQSSGGFMAASAILLEPDFFKVAVAKCGPQDPALYYHHWVERYSNIKETTDSTGNVSLSADFKSNNEIVNNLKGRLLLVQGDMDLHVPPSLTYRLAYDLMMANKRFDMFIIPKADHFWGDNYPYVIKYMELYFVENLMGDKTFNVNMFVE